MEPSTSHLSDSKLIYSSSEYLPDYSSSHHHHLPVESYRGWDSAQIKHGKTPIWSAVVASLLLGNTKALLGESGFSGIFELRQSLRNAYLDLYLTYHKSIDKIFNRNTFNSEVVRLNASGCQYIRTPDAFLEEFQNKVPLEVLDNVFKQLPSKDIRNVQLVCKQWRSLVQSRRSQYSKKLIPNLTISHNKGIIRTSNASNSIGMFGGSTRRVLLHELAPSLQHVRFNSLDMSIHGDIYNVKQLNIPIIETINLNIYFYNGVDHEQEKILELIEELNANPYISSISFVNFGIINEFPEFFTNYLEMLQIQNVSLRSY